MIKLHTIAISVDLNILKDELINTAPAWVQLPFYEDPSSNSVRKKERVDMQRLKWNLVSGKAVFLRFGDSEENQDSKEIKFFLTGVYMNDNPSQLINRYGYELAEPFSNYLLTFTDLFDNIVITEIETEFDFVRVNMDVEPKYNLTLFHTPSLNEEFRKAKSFQFFIYTRPPWTHSAYNLIHVRTENTKFYLQCQLVIL